MAGSFIDVELTGETQIHNLLNKLLTRGKTLKPAFAEMGEYLLESHQERFKLEVAPDGTPWDPLSPKTLSKKTDDRILQESGTLRDTLAYQASGDQLSLGTNLIYGATHQFGREADGIPARPFLGLANGQWNDKDEIIEIIKSHLLD